MGSLEYFSTNSYTSPQAIKLIEKANELCRRWMNPNSNQIQQLKSQAEEAQRRFDSGHEPTKAQTIISHIKDNLLVYAILVWSVGLLVHHLYHHNLTKILTDDKGSYEKTWAHEAVVELDSLPEAYKRLLAYLETHKDASMQHNQQIYTFGVIRWIGGTTSLNISQDNTPYIVIYWVHWTIYVDFAHPKAKETFYESIFQESILEYTTQHQ